MKSMTTGAVVDRHRRLDRRVHVRRRLAAQPDAAQRLGELHEVGDAVLVGAQVGVGVALVVEQRLPLPDHAEVAVVDDGDLDRDALERAGGQLLVGHLEAAVAVDRPHRRVRAGRPWRPSRPARRSPSCRAPPELSQVPGLLVLDELRRPHLVLADAGDVDRVRAGDLAEPLDDVLRGERAVGRLARSPAGTSRRQASSCAHQPVRSARWPASYSACDRGDELVDAPRVRRRRSARRPAGSCRSRPGRCRRG